MITNDVPIAITQGRMCVLDNFEYETGKTGRLIFHHIIHIIPGSGPTLCYGVDISYGPKWSKKKELRCQITTHAVIAVNTLDKSQASSQKDASWTVNVTERQEPQTRS